MKRNTFFIIICVCMVLFFSYAMSTYGRNNLPYTHKAMNNKKIVANEEILVEMENSADTVKKDVQTDDLSKEEKLKRKKKKAKRKAAKEAAKAEAERKAAEEAARAEAERKAAEEAARAEAERRAAEEAARVQAEQQSNNSQIQPSNPDAGCIDDASDILTY